MHARKGCNVCTHAMHACTHIWRRAISFCNSRTSTFLIHNLPKEESVTRPHPSGWPYWLFLDKGDHKARFLYYRLSVGVFLYYGRSQVLFLYYGWPQGLFLYYGWSQGLFLYYLWSQGFFLYYASSQGLFLYCGHTACFLIVGCHKACFFTMCGHTACFFYCGWSQGLFL